MAKVPTLADELRKIADHEKYLKDSLISVSGPSDAIRQVMESSQGLRDALKELNAPADAIRRFTEQDRSLRNALKMALAPNDAMRRFAEQESALKNTIKALNSPAQAIRQFAEPNRALKAAMYAPSSPPDAPPPTRTAIKNAAELGKLIKAARLRQGLSQQEFADLSGVGRRFLSELENGKPSLEFDKVVQVANAVGLDLIARSRS